MRGHLLCGGDAGGTLDRREAPIRLLVAFDNFCFRSKSRTAQTGSVPALLTPLCKAMSAAALSGSGRPTRAGRRRRQRRPDGAAGTSLDAIGAKVACEKLGYFGDPFVHEFGVKFTRKSPIIHRGYFARYKIFRDTLRTFHTTHNGVCQVIAFGGGLDTTYFDLAAQGMRCAFFLDVDLPSIAHYKAGVIASSPKMQAVMSTAVGGDSGATISTGDAQTGGSVQAADYALAPCDLADAPAVQRLLKHPGLNPRLPTLLLAECVFVYMQDAAVRELLSTAADAFHDCAFLGYDPIRPSDAFGEIMVQNLAAMGAPFVGIHACPDEDSHVARALECGFGAAAAVHLATAWGRAVGAAELQRLQRLEPLDETEEWELMMQHYALVGAVKGGAGGAPVVAAAASASASLEPEHPPPAATAAPQQSEVPLPAPPAAGSPVDAGGGAQASASPAGEHAVLRLFEAGEVKYASSSLGGHK